MDINKEIFKLDDEDIPYLSELDENADTIEVDQPQLDYLTIDIQKALRRYSNDIFITPFTLVAKLFMFEVDNKGNLRLKNVRKEYWKAIELYILLQFRQNKESSNKILVSARFLQNALCCRYETVRRAINILQDEELILYEKIGQEVHAVKQYITLLKADKYSPGETFP